jgi:hypothetical protein
MTTHNEHPTGTLLRTIVDADIAHIRSAMRQSLEGSHDNLVLTSPYWRRRLHQLMHENHLSKAQFSAVDALLAIIDRFDLTRRRLRKG